MGRDTRSCQPDDAPVTAFSLGAATSLGEAAARLRAAFAGAGLHEPVADARLLVLWAAGTDGTALIARPERALGTAAAARLMGAARRRLAREPVGRILGEREFWGLPMRLSPGTLEPRPDTETLVAAALAAMPDPDAGLSVLDLGTGTGCILLAILSERPRAVGFGVDRSTDALRTARLNAADLGLAARARFAASDWADAVGARFDLVVSNPPYIRSAVLPDLAPEVTGHDPAAALDGGPDGLGAYRSILPALPRLLNPNGRAFLEIGHDQGAALIGLAGESGLPAPAVLPDLAGRSRVVAFSL